MNHARTRSEVLSAELAQRLDPICDHFEAEWLAQRPPRLEEYLALAEEKDRSALLGELLALDREYRIRAGERPNAEEYQRRLPQYAAIVSRAFGLLTDADEVPPTLAVEPTQLISIAEPSSAPSTRQAGRYTLEEEIARGGMGAVWRAADPDLVRPLAVKVLLEEHRGQSGFERRFREEAQITGQLQHPGIPPVHEAGTLTDGRPFFAMKLIQGCTLADLLRQRTTPGDGLPRFVSIFEKVCQTLAYAHSRDIIHRDLKPSNVMVGAFGEVQVMDWGLAKHMKMDEGRLPIASNRQSSIGNHHSDETQAGAILGTPAYMSPEQARGEIDQLDARCDVYGLGAILCAILTGQPPHLAETGGVLGRAARGELENAFGRLDACGADAELVQLARSCLAPRKEDRPANAGMLAAAVAQYQASLGQRLHQAELDRTAAQTQAREEQKRRNVERQKRRLTLGLAAAVIVLVLLGSGAVLLWQNDRAERQRRHDLREQSIAQTLRQADQLSDALQAQLAKKGGVFQLLNNPLEWKQQLASVRAALERARELAAGGERSISDAMRQELQTLEERLAAQEADLALAMQLEKVRMDKDVIVEDRSNYTTAIKAYRDIFQAAKLVDLKDRLAVVVESVEKSAIKEQLLVALQDWALAARLSGDREQMRQLLPILRRLDSDPTSRQLWDEKVWESTQARTQFLRSIQEESGKGSLAAKLSPQALFLVGVLLDDTPMEAEAWLRKAQLHHPDDFWVNFQLAAILYRYRNPEEGLMSYRIALTLRPRSMAAHYRIGCHLFARRDYEGAIHHLTEALDLDPNNALVHFNLGLVLQDKKDLDGAIKHLSQAASLDPRHVEAHYALASALRSKPDLEGATAELVKVLKLKPGHFLAHVDLGNILRAQQKPLEAIDNFEKALKSVPSFAPAHIGLGEVLLERGEIVKARLAMQRALEKVAPNDPLRGNVQKLLDRSKQ